MGTEFESLGTEGKKLISESAMMTIKLRKAVMWLSNIVHQIALFLVREKILSEKDSQWGEYLIQKRVLSLGVFGVLLIVGCSLAGILESMCFIINFLYIRRRAGGYHASSPLRCLELSVTVEITSFIVVFVLENKIENIRSIYGILLACSILVIIFIYPRKYDEYGFNDSEWRVNKSITRRIIVIESIIYFLADRTMQKSELFQRCRGYYVASIVVVATFIIVSKLLEKGEGENDFKRENDS
ncbi:accessory gene regulator B family protein [Bariatricus sp. SGI.154]|uniref:accessory gene regulator B family protein n=1 Tax=Bariatricus sp. SGI.154 TaxID=3420549 RepID=UPI003CFD8FDC